MTQLKYAHKQNLRKISFLRGSDHVLRRLDNERSCPMEYSASRIRQKCHSGYALVAFYLCSRHYVPQNTRVHFLTLTYSSLQNYRVTYCAKHSNFYYFCLLLFLVFQFVLFSLRLIKGDRYLVPEISWRLLKIHPLFFYRKSVLWFILQLSSLVIADIDEGTVTLHPKAKIPRLPTYVTDMFKFRYWFQSLVCFTDATTYRIQSISVASQLVLQLLYYSAITSNYNCNYNGDRNILNSHREGGPVEVGECQSHLNTLNPNISVYILHNALHTFSVVMMRRIC